MRQVWQLEADLRDGHETNTIVGQVDISQLSQLREVHAQIDGSLELVVAQVESLQVVQTVDVLDRRYLVV